MSGPSRTGEVGRGTGVLARSGVLSRGSRSGAVDRTTAAHARTWQRRLSVLTVVAAASFALGVPWALSLAHRSTVVVRGVVTSIDREHDVLTITRSGGVQRARTVAVTWTSGQQVVLPDGTEPVDDLRVGSAVSARVRPGAGHRLVGISLTT